MAIPNFLFVFQWPLLRSALPHSHKLHKNTSVLAEASLTYVFFFVKSRPLIVFRFRSVGRAFELEKPCHRYKQLGRKLRNAPLGTFMRFFGPLGKKTKLMSKNPTRPFQLPAELIVYPQISFWVPIALAKISFSRIVITAQKYFCIRGHRP